MATSSIFDSPTYVGAKEIEAVVTALEESARIVATLNELSHDNLLTPNDDEVAELFAHYRNAE